MIFFLSGGGRGGVAKANLKLLHVFRMDNLYCAHTRLNNVKLIAKQMCFTAESVHFISGGVLGES